MKKNGGILVGSRSKKTHRPNSDWDFAFQSKDVCKFYDCAQMLLDAMFVCQEEENKITFSRAGVSIDLMLGYKENT